MSFKRKIFKQLWIEVWKIGFGSLEDIYRHKDILLSIQNNGVNFIGPARAGHMEGDNSWCLPHVRVTTVLSPSWRSYKQGVSNTRTAIKPWNINDSQYYWSQITTENIYFLYNISHQFPFQNRYISFMKYVSKCLRWRFNFASYSIMTSQSKSNLRALHCLSNNFNEWLTYNIKWFFRIIKLLWTVRWDTSHIIRSK
jgi:hypothetical protein